VSELERRLQRSWSVEDEFMPDQSKSHNECPLWAICYALFGITPPEVLPDGVFVDTTKNNPIETEDGRS
jgi:hypothetical protein